MVDDIDPQATNHPSLDELITRLGQPTATEEFLDGRRYRDRADFFANRLTWAPAVGNGAGVVALAGIIGNVASPDTAMTALTWPLAIFSAGLAFGIASVYLSIDVLELLGKGPATLAKYRTNSIEALNEVRVALVGLTVENTEERTTRIKAATARAVGASQPLHEFSRKLDRATVRLKVGEIMNWVAVGTVGIGFAVLLLGHATGVIKLERTTGSTLASARPIVLGGGRGVAPHGSGAGR